MSAKVRGPLQTIIGYGDIDVQTAGEDHNFSFDYVPSPYELENYVLEMHKKFYDSDDGLSEEVKKDVDDIEGSPPAHEDKKPPRDDKNDDDKDDHDKASIETEPEPPKEEPAHPSQPQPPAEEPSSQLKPPIDPMKADTPTPIPFDDQHSDQA